MVIPWVLENFLHQQVDKGFANDQQKTTKPLKRYEDHEDLFIIDGICSMNSQPLGGKIAPSSGRFHAKTIELTKITVETNFCRV